MGWFVLVVIAVFVCVLLYLSAEGLLASQLVLTRQQNEDRDRFEKIEDPVARQQAYHDAREARVHRRARQAAKLALLVFVGIPACVGAVIATMQS